MKVLIIDDDADIRFVAAMSLRAGGAIDVVEASGGLDGVCKAREEQPDVIPVKRGRIQSLHRGQRIARDHRCIDATVV